MELAREHGMDVPEEIEAEGDPTEFGKPEGLLTTRVDVGDYLWARDQSLRAHATQVDPSAGWWFGVDNETMAGIYPWEDWILARSVVGPIPGVDEERDLFAGVRERVTQ